MKTNVQSYGIREDKSMQTWIQLSRDHYKISNKEIKYFTELNLMLHQFKVLEVLYHRGDLSIGSLTKLTMSTPGNITVVAKNLKQYFNVLDDTELDTLYVLLRKLHKT